MACGSSDARASSPSQSSEMATIQLSQTEGRCRFTDLDAVVATAWKQLLDPAPVQLLIDGRPDHDLAHQARLRQGDLHIRNDPGCADAEKDSLRTALDDEQAPLFLLGEGRLLDASHLRQ